MSTSSPAIARFEYSVLPWRASDDGTALLAQLNALGALGWEAVGLAPRTTQVPMSGMGASAVAELVVLLKRPRQP